MALLARIKRDVSRNRGKAAVLGVLFTTMIVLAIRAVIQLRSADASVGMIQSADAPEKETTVEVAAGDDADARIKESQDLWKRLREVNGQVTPAVAFAFDSSYYAEDPTRRVVTPQQPTPVAPVTPVENPEAIKRAREAAIRDEARKLTVKSTTTSGTDKPWAIVNQQLVSIGDQVMGFEITAIRSREVEFVKEGCTIAVKMPDDLRGP